MHAGRLDQRVSVVRMTETADGGGGASVTAATLGTVWARVEPVRGQERVIADRQAGVQTWRVTARNAGIWSGITEADRLTWGSLTLNVRAAPPVGRAPFRTVEAESGVTNG